MVSSFYSGHAPNQNTLIAAAQAVAKALGDQQPYAIVGGAACALLGSDRSTSDVDLVVPKGDTKAARALLKSDPDSFSVDKRTQHTFYRSNPPVDIEILAPPIMFKGEFLPTTPVIFVHGGVRVLKPTLILNAKCNSVLDRSSSEKKDTDAQDILFLLRWCAANGVRPDCNEVPNASLDFVQWFIGVNGNEQLWTGIGFDLKEGKVFRVYSALSPDVLREFNSNVILDREMEGLVISQQMSLAN
jgi:hypothetical protein